jgi:Double zinc ribbon
VSELWVGILALAVVLVVVVVVVTFTSLRRYRLRRVRELRGRSSEPGAASDRAYNRLALARREAELLSSQGIEVGNAEQLIELANRSLDSRDFSRAYDLAQSAHETLVKARREPLRGAGRAPSPASSTVNPSPLPAGKSVAPGGSEAAPPTPSLPKNRAEAQFQLKMFEQDLVQAKKAGRTGPDADGGRELYVQAHAAFARGEYAEAFRLSLRGRRRIGGSVESLRPSAPALATSVAPSRGIAPDPVRTAEEVASAGRCAQCGHPTVAGDTYCRGCGVALSAGSCPSCGAPRTPRDTFCGKCGSRFG